MRRTLLVLLVIAGAGAAYVAFVKYGALLPFAQKNQAAHVSAFLAGRRFTLEVANTDEKRLIGLSGRASIDTQEGMLFVFDKPALYPFWMRGMQFPIDIIWLKDKSVVDVREKVAIEAGGPLHTYYPRSAADAAIELNAGAVEGIGLKIGDTASW